MRFLEGPYTRGAQIPRAKYKFCTVTPNICGPAVPNLPHVTLLTPRILIWLLEFWEISAPVRYTENAVGGVLGMAAELTDEEQSPGNSFLSEMSINIRHNARCHSTEDAKAYC